jgi:hypothetical protein
VDRRTGGWANFIYSGCQKNVPIAERFFCHNTYAAILFSENYYDNWYKSYRANLADDESTVVY